MTRWIRRLALALLVAAPGALLACGADKPTAPPASVAAEFTLTDVNPNSATTGQPVTPRAYLARVSAWYFGHAT